MPSRQEESRGVQEHPGEETLAPPVATGAADHGDAWADSVLGGLEDHPPCQHCLMGPCITVSEVTRIQGSCAPDITNR